MHTLVAFLCGLLGVFLVVRACYAFGSHLASGVFLLGLALVPLQLASDGLVAAPQTPGRARTVRVVEVTVEPLSQRLAGDVDRALGVARLRPTMAPICWRANPHDACVVRAIPEAPVTGLLERRVALRCDDARCRVETVTVAR